MKKRRRFHKKVRHGLLGATALVGGMRLGPGHEMSRSASSPAGAIAPDARSSPSGAAAKAMRALDAFSAVVRPLSHPRALEDALRSYFTYRASHTAEVRKPFLYFVDYGLPSTEPRGYVFDMDALTVVEGPFTVAHGRGSAADERGVPTRFSNAVGSAATSLGLYLADDVYSFSGKTAGQSYHSIGLRLRGLSAGFNDNAFARGVVAHGAPYVTPDKAGRSEGCPAMEPSRASRLLPMLANGGMVFLFAPNPAWMGGDPWLAEGRGTGSDTTVRGQDPHGVKIVV